MQFFYNSFPIHDIGEVTVSLEREFEGAEAAVRARVTLRMKVDVFAECFADNFDLLRQFHEALRTKHAVLQWRDSEIETDYVNQTAEPMSSTLPEDPNGWGATHQQVEVSFVYYESVETANNFDATFLRQGGVVPVPFGTIKGWTVNYDSRRFSGQRSQRQDAAGRVEASGVIPGDMSMSLSARRNALVSRADQMEAECNSADGLLVRGAFSQVVRMESFRAQVNAAATGIEWNFSATYSRFPNETGYATCEFTATQRDAVDDGDEFLVFTGRIFAPSESLARAKLATLRTTILASYGYAASSMTRTEVGADSVFANGDKTAGLGAHESADGTTFIVLPFSEEYRRRKSNVMNWDLRISISEDVTTNLVQTTYSGFVIASGATVDAAYAAALDKARALGDNKQLFISGNPFLRRSQITQHQRQVNPSNAIEFVRLEFAYEYQSKMATNRAYLEMSAELTIDPFGIDTENVSGFVVASSFTVADSIYQAQVKAAYTGLPLRGERVTKQRVQAQNVVFTAPQEVRFEFSFQVMRLKPLGQIRYRYAFVTSQEFTTMQTNVRVNGSMFVLKDTTAAAALPGILALIVPLGLSKVREEITQDHEYTGTDNLVKWDFDVAYTGRLTGIDAVCEMRLMEEVQYSGPRLVLQPTLQADDGTGGYTVPQSVSIQEGSRTIRGSVTGAERETCEAWARRHRLLLTGDANGGHYPVPDKMDWEYDFVPMVDGIAQSGIILGGVQNVRLWTVSFVFSEVLPNYPSP